jgi:predicted nuclease of predicted toxin-antitoxin system
MKEIKFLANVNVEKPIVDFLINKGFDVKWVANIDKKMLDIQIFEIANYEKRVIITNDKDFGEYTFYQRKTSRGIVLLRVKGQDSSEKIDLLDKLLDKYPNKILNHFVVVTRKKFRFVPMEVL